MTQKKRILLTLSQIIIGVILTLIVSMIYLLFFKKLIWELLINERIMHGFWVGLLLLISIACTYGGIVVSVTVGIQTVGRHFETNIPFKPVCSGAFLGAPAIVGLLALRNIPWDLFETKNVILNLLIPLLDMIAFILSLPVRIWLLLGIPVVILYVFSVPFGAILGYWLSNLDSVEGTPQET